MILPFLTINNIRSFYRLEGQRGAPVLVLSHSIGTDHAMWAPQVADLLPYFQVLRYDTRGHGASDAPRSEYTVEQLGRDVLGLADALGIAKFAFCGLSMGGAIGQWLALNAPDRLTALVLANTSAQLGPPANWDARRKTVLENGMKAIVDMALGRFFSAETLARGDVHANSVRSVLLGTDPAGYAGCCSALRDVDNRKVLRQIKVPTLVIVGDKDVSTPWEGHGEVLAKEIPGAKAVRLPAAHLSNLERPRSFIAALFEFLLPMASGGPAEAGMAVRRAMLGDAHVDRAIASATDFNRDFQDLITRYAWGTIWTRPGLDPRTRRLLVLAMMLSLGRWEEFSMHVRAGLANELEASDLKEVLLQAAIYAGVPVANTGFHLASQEIEKTTAH
jgi:3-oxoadipate enol-lactonase / 4-carboxymuconolactone decarboxylase